MVLHNSKWDKKATRNYNRKHGIVKSQGGAAQNAKGKNNRPGGAPISFNESDSGNDSSADDDDSENESGKSDDGEEENNPENLSALIPQTGPPPASATRGRRNVKNLPNNNWRYNDPLTEDEALIQELSRKQNELNEEEQMILAEQLEVRKTRQQIEEEDMRLARATFKDPKAVDLEAAAALDAAKRKKKHKNKYEDYDYEDEDILVEGTVSDEDDLEALLMASSSSAAIKDAPQEVVRPKKGNTVPFQDKTDFYKLQQEIEKAKAAKEIKQKFGSRPSKPQSKGNMAKGPKPSDVDPEEDIDDFLSSIDNLNITKKEGNSSNTSGGSSGPSLFSASTTTPREVKDLQSTEAWLDQLLK